MSVRAVLSVIFRPFVKNRHDSVSEWKRTPTLRVFCWCGNNSFIQNLKTWERRCILYSGDFVKELTCKSCENALANLGGKYKTPSIGLIWCTTYYFDWCDHQKTWVDGWEKSLIFEEIRKMEYLFWKSLDCLILAGIFIIFFGLPETVLSQGKFIMIYLNLKFKTVKCM